MAGHMVASISRDGHNRACKSPITARSTLPLSLLPHVPLETLASPAPHEIAAVDPTAMCGHLTREAPGYLRRLALEEKGFPAGGRGGGLSVQPHRRALKGMRHLLPNALQMLRKRDDELNDLTLGPKHA